MALTDRRDTVIYCLSTDLGDLDYLPKGHFDSDVVLFGIAHYRIRNEKRTCLAEGSFYGATSNHFDYRG